jgi:hypothetical protein
MQLLDKVRGATHSPFLKHITCDEQDKYNNALNALQEIRDNAWELAIKYRFDPVLSRAHEKYLSMLNDKIKELNKEV